MMAATPSKNIRPICPICKKKPLEEHTWYERRECESKIKDNKIKPKNYYSEDFMDSMK